jgi:polysaccharide biosynthesis/export protein
MLNIPKVLPFRLLMRSLLLLSLGMLLGGGCTAVPTRQAGHSNTSVTSSAVASLNNALASAALQTPRSSIDYLLGPEDLLQITLFNVPEAEEGVTPRRQDVRVSHEGTITLPLLGNIPAAGLTTSALEQSLRERYNRYLRSPQVGVRVMEYRGQPISVIGAVRNPGVFELTGPRTLVDLLSRAGLDDKAGTQAHIYRQSPEGRQTLVVDLLAVTHNPGLVNFPVQAGDVIHVPQAGMFFVDGAVAKPGSYVLNRPYTLTQALATAGGADVELAKASEIVIFRWGNGVEAERIHADLQRIMGGEASDLQVQPDDVIFVPMSAFKYFVKRFIGGISLGTLPVPR